MKGPWRVSSYSNGGDTTCVAVRSTEDGVEVMDTKLGDDSPVLQFSAPEWTAFLAGVRTGEFDLTMAYP